MQHGAFHTVHDTFMLLHVPQWLSAHLLDITMTVSNTQQASKQHLCHLCFSEKYHLNHCSLLEWVTTWRKKTDFRYAPMGIMTTDRRRDCVDDLITSSPGIYYDKWTVGFVVGVGKVGETSRWSDLSDFDSGLTTELVNVWNAKVCLVESANTRCITNNESVSVAADVSADVTDHQSKCHKIED